MKENKNNWGRKLSNTFVREGTNRRIVIRDGKNTIGYLFISVSKEGATSVYKMEGDYTFDQWEKVETNFPVIY